MKKLLLFVAVAWAMLAPSAIGPARAAGNWSWPVVGPVIRGFDPPDTPFGSGHRGIDIAVAVDTGKGFPDGSLPRILAAIGSGVGSLVLIGGALWSAWVFLRRRDQGRRALANAVIALGVFIAAAGGTVAFTGASGILELTNLIGVSVMFVGFLLA